MSSSDLNTMNLYVLMHLIGFDHEKLCLLTLKSSDDTTSSFVDSMKG
jgi:hypothetical protein